MSAKLIDGKSIASDILMSIQRKVKILKEEHNLAAGLAILSIGSNSASQIYIKNKVKAASQVGINCFEFQFSEDITEKHIIHEIETLNNDPKIHGIIIQLPVAEDMDKYAIINAVSPTKDVDGFSWMNIGKLSTGKNYLAPGTAVGCIKLIKSVQENLTGLNAVIIGRSDIVGKPVAALLLNENCTVTMIHSKSNNIEYYLKNADIIIVAIGVPNFLTKKFIKHSAIIIDVGITKDENTGKIIGDVCNDVKEIAGYVTPVPGGVGPMTIACLLENTLIAACYSKNIDYSNI